MNVPWKTIRVFISSTFKDMQAERDHLVRFVFPKLREHLLKYRIHLIDVDLRWGVTSDQDAFGVCREVIDECHPRFMGMLGGRYGWVPGGQNKSITADEIHYGVLERDAAKRGRAFFYFRDPKATAEIVEDDPGDFRETEGSDAAIKLTALKQTISDAKLPVFIYPAEWDVAQRRLTGLETFGNQVHADLLQSLKDDPDLATHFTSEGTAQPDEFAEEAEQMEAFIEERTQHYEVGSRQSLLNEMKAFAAADGTPNIFVLTGDPGSGKSALLAQFCRSLPTLSHANTPFLLLPHFVGASTGSTDLRRTLRRLCHELALAAGNPEPLPLDIKDLITHFQKLLAEAAGRRRVVLVFDALNQFDATDGVHWLNWLPRELPPGVRLVASVIAPAKGEKEHQTLAILRNRPDARVEKLEPLGRKDVGAIIEGYLKRYAKHLSRDQLALLLRKHDRRLPLYVLTALEELRTLGTYDEITDRIRTLPGDARALFGWILTERLANDPGFRDREGKLCGPELVEKFAACLGVSRHGLSQAELTALLDPGDPLGNVAALLRLLRPYLMRRGELLDFYHGQFREAASAAHLNTPEKQRAAHQSVATCLQAFADPHRDGQCRDATPHALSELPHHQTRAEAWPDLIATLENIFFLEDKVTHGMTFDLAVDFTAAVDALAAEHVQRQRLRLLNEALRRDIHFIARHANDYPQGLFQCLWNSAWWYDCPEAAQHYENGTGPHSDLAEHQNLSGLLERWRREREASRGSVPWLRSLRPPAIHLGTAQLAVLHGHDGSVWSVAFSVDGRRVLSGARDKTVRVWDAQSGAELAVLRGPRDIVTSVAFSPDGFRVASGSRDKTVRVWDTQSGAPLAVLRHELPASSVAFSPDGRHVLSGSWDGIVRQWDTQNGALLAVVRGHNQSVASMAFSCDGQRVLSGSADQTARLWDAHSGAPLVVLRGHESTVSSVAFSPDGRRVLSGSADATVRLWDAQSGAQLAEWSGHKSTVTSVAFCPDGRRILTGSDDGTVRLWDEQSGAELAVLRGHESYVKSVAFSPDGRRILSGSWDNTVRLWDAAGGTELAVLRGRGYVSTIVVSSDGRVLLSGSQLWDAHSGVPLAALRGHEARAISVTPSPDGRRVLTTSADNTICLWDAQSGALLTMFRGHEYSVTSVVFSPDGQRVLSGSGDMTLRLWDAQSGAQLAELRGHQSTVTSVAFSPDGRHVLSGSQDETVRLWDAESSRQLAELRGHKTIVSSVSFSPDGQFALSVSRDGTVRLWDTHSGAPIAMLHQPVTWVAFSGGGRRMEVGAAWCHQTYNTVILRESNSLAHLAEFRGHEDWVTTVSASPDGKRVLSGACDATVRLWDVPSGASLAVLRGHEDWVTSVTFSPDGNRVLSGSCDATVRLWDVLGGAALAVLRGHKATVTSAGFSPDGRLLLSKSADGTVRLWDAHSGECLQIFECHGINARLEALPYRLLARGLERELEQFVLIRKEPSGEFPSCAPASHAPPGVDTRWSSRDSRPIAWLPLALSATLHPSGRLWAGGAGSYLALCQLEGGESS